MSKALLTKRQVFKMVNRDRRLHKKLKWGSWDYFSLRAGVLPVTTEISKDNRYRGLYAPDAVQKIREYLRRNESKRAPESGKAAPKAEAATA